MAEGQAQLAILQQDAVQLREQQKLDFDRLRQLDELNTQLQVCAFYHAAVCALLLPDFVSVCQIVKLFIVNLLDVCVAWLR